MGDIRLVDLALGSPVVPQQPTTRECGCRYYNDGRPPEEEPRQLCALHMTLIRCDEWRDAAGDIIVRALFAVAGQVAAGATSADAVANVRTRFGI